MALDVLSTSTEVIRLLERSSTRGAGRRRPSSSSDLRRAVRLLEGVLADQGFLGGIKLDSASRSSGRVLDPETVERLDTSLARFVVHDLHYSCVPACCNASAIRFAQICTIATGLIFIGHRRPALLLGFETSHVQRWLQPASTRIAPAAATALALSPAGTARHWQPIAEALVRHPRWQVREFLLRAVARAAWPAAPRQLVDAVKRADRRGDPSLLREVWQRRALAKLTVAA